MMNQTWSIMRRLWSSLPRSRARNRTNKNQQQLYLVMVELLTTRNLYYVIDGPPKTNSLSQEAKVHVQSTLISQFLHLPLSTKYTYEGSCMNFNYSSTKLVTDRDDLMIRVRICRMWDTINFKKNGELISLDMIFVDEKGNLAHAIVRKNHISKFKHKLIEGSLFIIKNFKMVESSGVYRPVENSLKIIFFPSTVIKSLSEDIVHIPMNGFHFIKSELIESRVNNNALLSVSANKTFQ
ncbi:hypothetical protein P3L10_015324 [Capsicum annuum]